MNELLSDAQSHIAKSKGHERSLSHNDELIENQ